MAPTLRLSEEGKDLIDRIRKQKGWTKNSFAWRTEAWEFIKERERENFRFPSESSQRRFLAGVGINPVVFQAFCAAVGVDWRATIETNDTPTAASLTSQIQSPSLNFLGLDPYEGVPLVQVFYGRVNELRQLQQWLEERCRLVIVYGIGGIGKTQLVAKVFAEQNQQFARLLWQNFSYTLPLEDLLADLIIRLSPDSNTLPKSREALISTLLKELQREKTLIILDEKNLYEESDPKSYSTGYKRYSTFLQQLNRENHQSCIVLTTQEKPTDVTAVADDSVKAFNLEGLDSEAGCQLLTDKNLVFNEETGKELVRRYRGNPLLLQLVSSEIRGPVFRGNVRDFLAGNSLLIPNSIESILQQLIQRLSKPEKDILYCLARVSTRVSYSALTQELPHISFSQLVKAINALERRSLLEKESEEYHYLFTLQPMVMKFVQQR